MSDLLARYRSQSTLARESWLLLVLLSVGVIVLPVAVYVSGHELLGPYARGGFFRFWGDFFLGLARGGLPWWLLAIGPYALVMSCRVARFAWRRSARV
ncbi:MAG: hypothetical protein KIT78_07790 [Steroidobacteraceae bacterium]|nr:hypothetical protein [Steroidobacteraceae bacterium]